MPSNTRRKRRVVYDDVESDSSADYTSTDDSGTDTDSGSNTDPGYGTDSSEEQERRQRRGRGRKHTGRSYSKHAEQETAMEKDEFEALAQRAARARQQAQLDTLAPVAAKSAADSSFEDMALQADSARAQVQVRQAQARAQAEAQAMPASASENTSMRTARKILKTGEANHASSGQHYTSRFVVHFTGTPAAIAENNGVANERASEAHLNVFKLDSSADVDSLVGQGKSVEEMNELREFENGFVSKMRLVKSSSSFPKPIAVQSVGIEHANGLNLPHGQTACFSIAPGTSVAQETIYDTYKLRESQTRRVFGGESFNKIWERDMETFEEDLCGIPDGAIAVRKPSVRQEGNHHSGPSPLYSTIKNYCKKHGAEFHDDKGRTRTFFPWKLANECIIRAKSLAMANARNVDLRKVLDFKAPCYTDGCEFDDFAGTALQREDQVAARDLARDTPMHATAEIEIVWTVPLATTKAPARQKKKRALIDRVLDAQKEALSGTK